MKRLIFSLAFIATFALANAQVTIGTDKEPSKAALLDIKDQNSASAGGVTSTTGGLLLPRVNLVNVGDLEPFITGGGTADEKANHKGLVVYNLTNNASFKPGLYTWDGTGWILAGEGVTPTVTAGNGLTKSGNMVELGGTLTKATAINQGANTLTYSGTGALIVGSPLRLTSGTPGAGKVLTSDASGNATWQTTTALTGESTTASNGLTLNGYDVRLGGALSGATAITHGANTLTHSGTGALIVGTPLQITSGTPGAGKLLSSDATGNATWGTVASLVDQESTTASNGLTLSTKDVQLGGNLTKATAINLNGNTFGITTGTGQRLDITGNLETDYLYVNNAPSTSGNSRALVLNQVTKQIETALDIPTSMTFLQSGTETVFGNVTTSQTSTRVVPWSVPGPSSTGGDMVTNNMMDYVPGEEAFQLREDTNVEISGYVGYISNSTDNNGVVVSGSPTIINASLQLKRDGSSTWEDYTSVRGVYTEDMTPYRQTLNIPPAMIIGKAGDMVRMVVVIRPGSLGNAHPNARIVVPFGTKFSKSLKIVSAGKGTT